MKPSKQGGSHIAQEINVSLLFIIDDKGEAITGYKRVRMHSYAWTIWQGWLNTVSLQLSGAIFPVTSASLFRLPWSHTFHCLSYAKIDKSSCTLVHRITYLGLNRLVEGNYYMPSWA